jgi:hypothetical protein
MEASGQLHAPTALPQYQFDRRLVGPRNRSGHSAGEEEDTVLSGIEPRSSRSYRSQYSDLAIIVINFLLQGH